MRSSKKQADKHLHVIVWEYIQSSSNLMAGRLDLSGGDQVIFILPNARVVFTEKGAKQVQNYCLKGKYRGISLPKSEDVGSRKMIYRSADTHLMTTEAHQMPPDHDHCRPRF